MRHWKAALFALLASSILAAGCGGGASEPPGEEGGTVDASEAPPVNVRTVALEASSLTDDLSLAGRLEPWVEVQISTELGGTVQDVGFEKGQRIRQGQVLARIGTDLLEASLAEAEAELAAAEATYNKARELFERQAVPRQELIDATASFKRAEARLQLARLRVERSIIKSPVDGVAISREIELGEVVAPGALVTTVHQVARLKASVGIPEDDIGFFEVGGPASVEVDAYPDKSVEGRIHYIAPAATGKNRTFPAEIAIANEGRKLRPGMIVRVRLVRRVFEDAVVVSRDAILERDSGNVAFVHEDGRAVERPVETGPSHSGRIVVTEGLSLGEELIVTGHRNLVDGQRVRIVEGAEAAPASAEPTS